MDEPYKKVLRAVTLEMRHILEGTWSRGAWLPGDLEQRLRGLGVRADGTVVPVDELGHLSAADVRARVVIDAWLTLRRESGASGADAVAELVRETAWSWANRLLALRCMETRDIIEDEVIVTKSVYAGRSLRHHRLVRRRPELEREEDGGLFAALNEVSAELAQHLPHAFDADAPGIALRPSVAALTQCIGLLSGTQRARGQEAASEDVFKAPDALGWAYQYWNTEEKQRVFDRAAGKGADRKRHKIERGDIIPATQLYTEPYMVQFLVQNSLGALWTAMHPETQLPRTWRYFVREADRPASPRRPLREITFLDPACGSGHFLLEAFDLFFAMYREEDPRRDPTAIASDILTRNLHGLDIDERAVQIAEVSLWMRAVEVTRREGRAFPMAARANLVATNVHLPRGKTAEHSNPRLETFLKKYPEDEPLRPALQVVFQSLEHADQLGALLLLDQPVDAELKRIKIDFDKTQTETETDANSQLSLFRRGPQTVLPRSARSFGDWRNDVLGRLREHFELTAQSSDAVQAFFGRSAERALDVFDVLSERYDVVAANPPYMGSKNMGPVLRTHVEAHFTAGKRDLYAAFILRCHALLREGGRVAVVAPQAWLFMRSYVGMRVRPGMEGTGSLTGLLAETRVETLAQLGRHAFTEADPPGNVAMFVLHDGAPDSAHRPVCVRLALPRPAEKQAEMLAAAAEGNLEGLTWRPIQRAFLDVPQAPFCYWLRPRFLELFAGKTVADLGEVRQGTATADDGRFLRFVWEVDAGERWSPFYKGGGYRKWDGLVSLLVDWEQGGARLRSFPRAVIRNPDAYFKPGWSYSLMARGRMSVRVQCPPGVIGHKGPGIYTKGEHTLAVLNSRTFSHMLRAVSPNLGFEVEVVTRGPLPASPLPVDTDHLVTLKSHLTATDPTERAFTGVADLAQLLAWCAELHTLEGESERAVMAAYGLDEDDVAAVLADTGTPAGWLADSVTDSTRLRALFEAGPGGEVESEDSTDEDDDGEGDAAELGTGRPIHPETFLEELCEKAGVSPRAAWSAIQVGLASGWRCPSEERRIAADRVTVQVLRLLGHRWPLEIERGEPVPDWADTDGVIPLTSIPHERPLIERLRERWDAEGIAEAELSAALEMPVDQWLHTRFAAAHTSQFKRRPPAWQVQSGTFTTRRAPAFACLVYAQRVSGELLAGIRSQYVGPLLERRRQEVRTFEAATGRSAAQEQHLREASGAVAELEQFAETLARIEREGFTTPGLREIAVRDAIECLVKPVLSRWRDELIKGPLREWVVDARSVDEVLAIALHKQAEALPLSCGEWAALVRAPEWGSTEPATAAIHSAVLSARDALTHAATTSLHHSLDGAFGAWKRERREEAERLKQRAPRFKKESDRVDALARRIRAWTPAEGMSAFLAGLPLYDRWCAEPGRPVPSTPGEFVRQESAWRPDVNDGVRVNIAPLQRAGLLAEDPLAGKDVESAIADRAAWRADERRWVRAGRLAQPGWWPKEKTI